MSGPRLSSGDHAIEDLIRPLVDYTAAWREELGRALANLPHEDFLRRVEANGAPVGHGALRETLLHVVHVEASWVREDIEGQREPDGGLVDWDTHEPPEKYPDVASILAWGREVRAELEAWVPRWREEITLAGREDRSTVGDVLLHTLLHEAETHGDLTTILAALGRRFDFFFISHRLGLPARF